MRYLTLFLLLINSAYGQQPLLVNGYKYAGPTFKTIWISFNGGGGQLYGGTNWNNHTTSGTGSSTTSNLVYIEDGSNSGINSVLSNTSNVSDNGSGYCSGNSTIFPTAVLRYANNASSAISPRTLTFQNVPAGTHTFSLLATRSGQAVTENFTINSVTSSNISVNSNCSTSVASLTYTQASTGNTVITLSIVSGSFNYLNAIKLEVHPTAGFAKVTPTDLNKAKEMLVVSKSTIDALAAIKSNSR